MRKIRRTVLVSVLVLAGAIGLATPALANHLPTTVWLDVAGGSPGTQVNTLGTSQTVGDLTTWTLTAPAVIEGITIDSWQASFKEDPYVTNNIVVTNTTAFTQTFVATVVLPIPAFNYDEIISSSVGVTVTDSNGNNVLSFANSGPTAIYQGTVNGVTLLSLNPGALPLTTADCAVPFAGCSAVASAGVASQAAGPGVANQIGITLTFELSAGDSAGITSRFEIVPEPGTAALLGVGLASLAALRRRRQA